MPMQQNLANMAKFSWHIMSCDAIKSYISELLKLWFEYIIEFNIYNWNIYFLIYVI